MRIFKDCREMLNESIREVFTRGQTVFDKTVQGKIVSKKDYEQKEIIAYNYRVNSFDDLNGMLKDAKETFGREHFTEEIAKIWFDDMINNKSLKESWWDMTEYTKQYFKEFCDEGNGNASYSYGERIAPQVPILLKRLKQNLYSRGAQIAVWKPDDLDRIGRRVPCTTTYHFLARKTVIEGDKLNLIVCQRSCDLTNFFPLDVYKAALLLEHVAKEIGVKTGFIVHQIGSLHAYKKDVPTDKQW